MSREARGRSTRWNLFFQFAAIGLTIVSGVVMVPIYLQHVGTLAYGAWLATGNVLAWLAAVDPGFSTVAQQRVAYAFAKNDRNQLGRLIGGAFVGSTILAAGVLLLTGVVSLISGDILPIRDASLSTAFAIAGIGTALSLFGNAPTTINLALHSAFASGVVYVTAQCLALALTLLALNAGWSLIALAVGVLVRGAGICAGNCGILFYRLRQLQTPTGGAWLGFRDIMRDTTYNAAARIAGIASQNADSYVTATALSLDRVTTLDFTRKPAVVIQLLAERPALALAPALAHAFGAADHQAVARYVVRIVDVIAWVLVPCAVALILLNQRLVALWVGPQHFGGHALTLAVAASLLVTVCISAATNIVLAAGAFVPVARYLIVEAGLVLVGWVLTIRYLDVIALVLVPLVVKLCWSLPLLLRLSAKTLSDNAFLPKTLSSRLLAPAASSLAAGIIIARIDFSADAAGLAGLATSFFAIHIGVAIFISPSFRAQVTNFVRTQRIVSRGR